MEYLVNRVSIEFSLMHLNEKVQLKFLIRIEKDYFVFTR